MAHGPSFGNERWEEQSGYSPSTIAAEIAGLAAAGAIADRNGDAAGARVYRATADQYQRSIKGWTVTTTGPLSTRAVLHPAVQDRRPERGAQLRPRLSRSRTPSSLTTLRAAAPLGAERGAVVVIASGAFLSTRSQT